jgi:hypothetical protein
MLDLLKAILRRTERRNNGVINVAVSVAFVSMSERSCGRKT